MADLTARASALSLVLTQLQRWADWYADAYALSGASKAHHDDKVAAILAYAEAANTNAPEAGEPSDAFDALAQAVVSTA